jgi:vacuolar-type H+-ATPase subunit F/Vma7
VNTTSASTIVIPSVKVMPFDGFVFFSPFVKNYTGSKKLTAKDLGLRADQLPPSTLAKLGTIASCDPSKLNKLESFRAAQRNVLLKKGTRIMGLFGVPADAAAECASELDKITREFYDCKSELIATFETDRDKWLDLPEFAPWIGAIKARLDPIGHIEKQIQCDWFGFTIGDSAVDLSQATSSALSAGLERAKTGVGNQVLDEVAVIAATTFRSSLHDDKGNKVIEVTQRILSPIKRIKEKLDALSFADPRLSHVISYIDSVLVLLPSSGKMSSNHLNAIYSLLSVLSDPDTIAQFVLIGATASAVISAGDAQQVLDIVSKPIDVPLVDSTPVANDDLDAWTTQPSAATVQPDSAPAVAQTDASTETSPELVYDDF